MSVLVGDVIIKARNAFKDPCATLFQPSSTVQLTPTTVAGGSLAGAYYYQVTWATAWGETLPSPEGTVNITGAFNGFTTSFVPPPGATSGKIYFGPTPSGECQYVPINMAGPTVCSAPGIGARVPINNRAYLPDTDGSVNANQIYNWLNSALVKMGVYTGGQLDENGVAIPSGSAEFVMPGWWFSLTDMWHDGWVVLPERAVFTWMKSTVSGVPGIVSVWQNANRQVLGLWPQPSLGAQTTTLTSPAAMIDTVFNVANSANFRAPGLGMVDGEVFAYSSIGGTVYPNPPYLTGSAKAAQGQTTMHIVFGSLPSGLSALQPQVGTSWQTATTISNLTMSTFDVTFGTPAPFGGGLVTWTVQGASATSTYNVLGNLVRGLGATAAAPHLAGATVSYLNFRFRGYRIPTLYQPGQATQVMDLPPAWDQALHHYMLGEFRAWEQDDQDANSWMQTFKAECEELKGMQADPTGPRQLGWVAPFVGDSQNLEELVGTILIP